MSTKIAVAIIHGVGKQDPNFADEMIQELRERFISELDGVIDKPEGQLVFEPIYWAPALHDREEKLWKLVQKNADLDFLALRQLVVDFAGDAIAYQPVPHEQDIYNDIHEIVAKSLHALAQEDRAGSDAPLAVIAHSLGSVIAGNYFYDLQAKQKKLIPRMVTKILGKAPTPLEAGKTFARFFTMGSPIAIWSLRYDNFGKPIRVSYLEGEWLNFFDEDDILGYPLKTLNKEYKKTVTRDIPVNVGNWLTSWNPASHLGYWTDNDVTIPIAKSLAKLWRGVNRR